MGLPGTCRGKERSFPPPGIRFLKLMSSWNVPLASVRVGQVGVMSLLKINLSNGADVSDGSENLLFERSSHTVYANFLR